MMTHDMWVVVLLVLLVTAVALMAVQCFCVGLSESLLHIP